MGGRDGGGLDNPFCLSLTIQRGRFCPYVTSSNDLSLSQLCRAAPLASSRQMGGQVSRGSIAEYQADERAGVAGLSWRVSGR